MTQRQDQDASIEFESFLAAWANISKWSPHRKDYNELQSWLTDLFRRMNSRIHTLEITNLSYQQSVQQLEEKTQSQQEEIQLLQVSKKALNDEKEQLNIKYTETLSRIAQLNRVSTNVYTSGKSFQTVTVGRDYREFVEQTVPRCIRIILRYLQEMTPSLGEKSNLNGAKNLILSILTYDILSTDSEDTKEVAFITQHICRALKIPSSSFSQALNKDLEQLVQGGQILANTIFQSGGKLVFYENEQFDEKYHEMVAGSSSASIFIQYTATPAYVVKLVRTEDPSDVEVLIKAKVVMGDS